MLIYWYNWKDVFLLIIIIFMLNLKLILYRQKSLQISYIIILDKTIFMLPLLILLSHFAFVYFSSSTAQTFHYDLVMGSFSSYWRYLAVFFLFTAFHSLLDFHWPLSYNSSEAPVNSMVKANARSRYCVHELFGFDVLLDENLKPWILEVNISPR